MGLQDDLNRAQAAARATGTATRGQVEAALETATRVWHDFLAYCRDFAALAPQRGIAPMTGKETVARGRDKSRSGPGNMDLFIVHPGGWVINRGPRVTPMFYITTAGDLYIENSRSKTGSFPTRQIITYGFHPCPAFPASPPDFSRPVSDTTVSGWMPWRFEFTSRAPMGASEVVRDDIARLGGSVVLDTPWDKSFAKDHVLKALSATGR